MEKPRDFAATFKAISHAELLDILDNPGNYQPAAVEAARKEIEERKLSDEELEMTRELNVARFAEDNRAANRIKDLKVKMSDTGRSFWINLITKKDGEESGRSPERMIRIVSLCYFIIILYSIITERRTLLDSFMDVRLYPGLSAVILLPLALLIAGTIGFWRKKPWGWVLLVGVVSLFTLLTLSSLVESFQRRSSLGSLSHLFPAPRLELIFVQMVLLAGTLLVVCKRNLRKIFDIGDMAMLFTLASGLLLLFFFKLIA